MFYKHRKMEAENQLFVHRIGQLPVVKAASERALCVYEGAKNYNRLINATLNMAENSVKYASQVEAVKKIMDSQLVSLANKVAVTGLDKIENNYPVVKKTPQELWATGSEFYEHSRLKGGVDKLNSVKDYGLNKVSNTKKYYQDLVSGNLTRLLDFSDDLVNKYVVPQGEANGQLPNCGSTNSYLCRAQCISGKFYRGVKYQAGEKYLATKQYAMQTLGDLHVAMLLIEHAKNSAAWLNEKTHVSLTMAQEQAKALWNEIQRRAEPLSGRSEAIVLALVRGLASNIAALSEQVVKYSAPYLPEGVEKTVAAGSAYAIELRDSFAKAKTLGDLRDEVITEAKHKLTYIQEGLTKGMDYLLDLPPISWLAATRHPVHEKAGKPQDGNGHVPDGYRQHDHDYTQDQDEHSEEH